MNNDEVVLVDTSDRVVGKAPKLEVHEKGLLHRAFSIFIFNDRDEMLLQKRNTNKYHSPGLWSNTCCSHPRPGEEYLDAAHRRLMEEMGFDVPLEEKCHFIYKASVGKNLIEHEFDRVFFGFYNKPPQPNPEEVEDWKYCHIERVKQELEDTPDKFTVWFQIAFNRVYAQYQDLKS